MAHLKVAFRQLIVRPGLSATVVLMLAVGIGATTAIYSLFHQILVEPLPVPEPERLVNLSAPGIKYGSTWGGASIGDGDALFTHEMYEDLEARQTVFSGLAAQTDFPANLGHEDNPRAGLGSLVSGNYFDVLGLTPALGRLIQTRDTEVIDQSPVVVLNYDYWQREFGGDPAVLGEALIVNGRSLEIVGVAPKGFAGTAVGWRPEVYVPYTLRWLMEPSVPRNPGSRSSYWLYLFGRLAPGVSREQAQSAITSLYRDLRREFVLPLLTDLTGESRDEFLAGEILLEPGARGKSNVPVVAGQPVTMLLALTAAVLLIVCVNVAGLLLARGVSRAREMAIRASIGASRRRLLIQSMLESAGLAAVGGALSLPVAAASLALIAEIVPADLGAGLDFGLEPVSFAFMSLATIATVLAFGLGPAWVVSGASPGAVIKSQSAQSPGGRGLARFRSWLMGAQVAFSMVLLVLAGLFAQSLANVGQERLGIDVDSLASFRISPRLNGYEPEDVARLADEIEAELRAQPEVAAVGTAAVPLLAHSLMGYPISTAGHEWGPGVDNFSQRNIVSPGFFRATSMRILAGRDFSDLDRVDSPPVAIVNEAFVEKFELGPAVGRRFSLPYGTEDIEIVGVVADAKYNSVKNDVAPEFFQPRAQVPDIPGLAFYVRTTVAPELLLPRLPGLVARIDPGLPVSAVTTMERQVDENVYLDRLTSLLATIFAAIASLLAAIGLYGLMAYNVSQRTRELGLRLALGAEPRTVARMVIWQVGRIAAIGGVAGVVLAALAGRAADALLFGLSGIEPMTLAGAAATLAVITASAGYLPARRAARIEPMEALRYE